MATQTIITDDLDGSHDARTVHFSLEGQAYTVDLSQKNLDKLEGVLAPFIDAGKKVGGPKAAQSVRGSKRGAVPAGDIREWAKTQGPDIASLVKSDRGAVNKKVIAAYNEAHGTAF